MILKLPGKTNTYGIYVKAALKKGLEVRIIDQKNRLAELSYGGRKIYLYDMALPLNDAISVMLARQKYLTKKQVKTLILVFGC